MFRPDQVVDSAEQSDDARDQYGIVHGRSINCRSGWPETEEEDEGQIYAGKSVVSNTECTRNLPWSPVNTLHAVGCDGWCGCLECLTSRKNGAGTASVEK